MKFKIGHKINVGRTNSGMTGKNHTDKSKQQMSLVKLGKHYSPETEFKKGMRLSEETKRKMSLARIGHFPWSKGIKLSEEHKQKISLSNIGKHNMSNTEKENLRIRNIGNKYNLGKHLSDKTRKKISINSSLRVRDKASNWQGGISELPYGTEFNKSLKEQIRNRDQYRCQQCFREQDELRTETNRKRKLAVHHIDFNKRNSNPNNLISLCQRCHMQTNFNRDGWTNYFNNNMELRGIT